VLLVIAAIVIAAVAFFWPRSIKGESRLSSTARDDTSTSFRLALGPTEWR
jgi:hypothetical protein